MEDKYDELRTVLSCTARHESLSNSIHYQGIVLGVCSAFKIEFGLRNNCDAMRSLLKYLPKEFKLANIPTEIVNPMDGFGYVHPGLPNFMKVFKTIPEEEIDKHFEDMVDSYLGVARLLSRYAYDGVLKRKKVKVIWNPFDYKGGYQTVSYAAVLDLGKEFDADKVNWHGNNLSQVIFNCGLCYSEGKISIHT